MLCFADASTNGDIEHVKRNTARALERGYRHISCMNARPKPLLRRAK